MEQFEVSDKKLTNFEESAMNLGDEAVEEENTNSLEIPNVID